MKNTFSSRLEDAMHANRINKSQLAKALKTTPSTVGRWFEGSVPQLETLDQLCAILSVEKEWLLTGENITQVPEMKVQRVSPEFFSWEAERIQMETDLLEHLKILITHLALKSEKEFYYHMQTAKQLVAEHETKLTDLRARKPKMPDYA